MTDISEKPPAPDGLGRSIRRASPTLVSSWYRNQFAPELHSRFPNAYAEEAPQHRVETGYLAPLLELLARYASSGDPLYRDLYLWEWRRYAPHRKGNEVLLEYFRALVPLQEQALLVQVKGTTAAAEWLAALHRPLVSPAPRQRLRVLTIGDCLLSEVQTFLWARGVEAGLDFDFRYYYFSSLVGADIAADGIRRAIEDGVDALAASYLTYQGIPLYRSLLEGADKLGDGEARVLVKGITKFMRDHIDQMRALTDVPLLLHNACGLPLARWRRRLPWLEPLSRGRLHVLALMNEAVTELASEIENCVLVDETAATDRLGHRALSRGVLPWRLERQADFHPAHLGRLLADTYADILHSLVRFRKTKVLAVDFDNTLWLGVMADGEVSHYRERQQLLKALSEQGMVLTAVSKNDPNNIRWDEMLLKPDDFAALKISWHLKAQSIRELAAELNLGLDAFLLIDDNPTERALIREQVPEVGLLDATDPAEWTRLGHLFAMPNTRLTDEARRRTQLYREQAQRAQSVHIDPVEQDYPALMRTLGLKARIGRMKRMDLDRVTELVQRTNQFNTTTIRYSRAEIEQMTQQADADVLVGELEDRFGNLGLVGVVIVRRTADEAVLDSFIMSCRAMGFGFEHVMLAVTVSTHPGRTIVGRFVPTDRNEPASNFFAAAGFVETEHGTWLAPAGTGVRAPDWILVEQR